MQHLLKKLNYKSQKEFIAINAPSSFLNSISLINPSTSIITEIESVKKLEFIIAFVTDQFSIDELAQLIDQRLEGDGIVWFAYPKITREMKSPEINRDCGWDSLGHLGFEAVRQISIDETWSAIRFRKVEYIKKMIRKSGALSIVGKKTIQE